MKPGQDYAQLHEDKSPSAGGRGLKRFRRRGRRRRRMSPSAGGRGLKLVKENLLSCLGGVALRRRAWIETTTLSRGSIMTRTSPSAGGRGLKHGADPDTIAAKAVALRRRAWIETTRIPESSKACLSRPPQEGVD